MSFNQSGVRAFSLSPDGNRIAYIESVKDKNDKSSERLVVKRTKDGEVENIFSSHQKYMSPVWSASSNKMAFFFSSDTSENNYQLTVHDFGISASLSFGDTLDNKLDKSLVPSQWRTPFFSHDENRLFFGVHERAQKEPEDSLLADEKYHVDIWHYQDQDIQPRQKKSLKRDKKKNDLYVYNFDQVNLQRLSNDTLSVMVRDEYEPDYALAYSNESYAIESQWSYPWKNDYFLISLDDGQLCLLYTSPSPRDRQKSRMPSSA